MAHQSTDHCVWNCLESVRGVPYELSSNTDTNVHEYTEYIYICICDSIFMNVFTRTVYNECIIIYI